MQGGWSEDGPKASWTKSRDPLRVRKRGGSQSPHSSAEAGNDRGAKGGRKVNDEQDSIRLHKAPSVPLGARHGADSRGPNARSCGSRKVPAGVWIARMLEALARGNEGSLHPGWNDVPNDRHPSRSTSPAKETNLCGHSPTGEPDAGNLPVRFGGRGGAIQCAIPTSILGHKRVPLVFPARKNPSGAGQDVCLGLSLIS
jgi:hypothetical protein